ncbi:hypothetical protein C2U70_30885 [Bradyrhizobium guangdongense]|uniref:class I SAM-dependent methyltransferase n=1 Tax=Bradyrhizobium guangdongense TaxID=1325090 RepID=UPI00112C7EEC|nr:class I SAM-dependent methyltransferase [Bradyrhizobium guangdongense]TPQ27237.1 hypothetical protein C2U70_30885 [Bradyrhizobium guangdongense]
MNPQPSWEELQPYYDHNYSAYRPTHDAAADDTSVVKEARRTGQFRDIPLRPKMRILDVGCGGGYFLHIMKILGATTKGIEPSPHGARAAKQRGIEVFNGMLEDFAKTTSERFDVITAHHVLEHAPDPIETLQTMKQLLAPGGVVWIEVPNAGYTLARACRGYWHSTDLPFHLMQFTPKSVALAGKRAGLEVQYQKSESKPENVAASMRLYLRFRWMIPLRVADHIWPIQPLSKIYAKRVDASLNGESVITQFVP